MSKITDEDRANLPADFDWRVYKKLNSDLERLGFVEEHHLIAHFLKYGRYEGRQYSNIHTENINKKPEMKLDYVNTLVPKDFNWHKYLSLNPDLSKENINTELLAKLHYIEYGKQERRAYSTKLSDLLPIDFDARLYKLYNPDLSAMSNAQASMHFISHGQNENRTYYTGMSYDEIYQQKDNISHSHINKNSILLINHDISLTGAPIYLYDLYDYLYDSDIYKNIYIVEPFPNNILPNHPAKLYHYNEIESLKKIFETTQPVLIYSNSINYYLYNLHKFNYWHNKTIVHLHETYEDFAKPMQSRHQDTQSIDNIQSISVVSEKIKQEFLKHKPNLKEIRIDPPFIPTTKQNIIQGKADEGCDLIIEDKDKPVIGMCGDLSLRKNPILLLQLARDNPQYIFVWIGGKKIEEKLQILYPNDDTSIPSNFLWVPNTDNPYKYIKRLDYFILTSLSDPCPIVVLEALLLNKKIIVIENNIHTSHDTNKLESYFILKGQTNEDIRKEFQELSINVLPNLTQKNTKYINDNYSQPIMFNPSRNTKKDFIILSLYINNISKTEIDYYINIINQFIVRQQQKCNFVPVICISSDDVNVFGPNIKNYLEKSILNLKKFGYVIFRKNCGYDIGGLLEGLKYIYESSSTTINTNTQIAYIHNKNNQSWKNILHSIFYINDVHKYDTLTASRFTTDCLSDDLNRKIMENEPDIFHNLHKKQFKYIQGTTFISKLSNLKPLVDDYDKIVKQLTSIKKHDTFWIECMKDDAIFNRYMQEYSNQSLNSPIDFSSQKFIKDGTCFNFMQLYSKYKLKGIPDLQFEHALERYIGALVIS
jgi:hypothetical protein